jgi:Flp pilus assembly protein protease CpaA
MRIFEALQATLVIVGVLGVLESLSRRVWASKWIGRGFSKNWSQEKATSVRFAAGVMAAMVAGVAFDSLYACAAFAALAWLASLAIATDLTDMKIPSEPVWVVSAIALVAALSENILNGNILGNPNAMIDMLIAEAVVLGVMLLTVLASSGGIGSGDVRLVAALTISTAWVGAGAILPALALASVGFLATRYALRIPLGPTGVPKQPVPFAPGLIAGYAIVAFVIAFISLFNRQ